MTTYSPGTGATFDLSLPVDATAITVEITDAAGDVQLGPTSVGIAHPGTGQYLYTWAIPAGQDQGSYILLWRATVSGIGEEVTEEFAVSATDLPGTWCPLTDVVMYTGSPDATQVDLNVAQVLLEGHIHRVWRSSDVETRDYYWLTRATAFQAVYVHAHPELLTMMDVAALAQDGLSITFRSGTQTLPLIAPMARRLLDAIYRGSNTTARLNSAFQRNRMARRGIAGSASWRSL